MQEENRTQPMSVKDWLITCLTLSVPVVNILMLFVWASSDNTNVNKQNWTGAGFLIMKIYHLFKLKFQPFIKISYTLFVL